MKRADAEAQVGNEAQVRGEEGGGGHGHFLQSVFATIVLPLPACHTTCVNCANWLYKHKDTKLRQCYSVKLMYMDVTTNMLNISPNLNINLNPNASDKHIVTSACLHHIACFFLGSILGIGQELCSVPNPVTSLPFPPTLQCPLLPLTKKVLTS